MIDAIVLGIVAFHPPFFHPLKGFHVFLDRCSANEGDAL
jgi:hypothetical protein